MWCTYLTYFIHNSSVRDSTAVFLPAPRPCLRCGACTCWALQRTQRAKGMKQLQITRNFCSPRIIHSVCLLLWVSPIMFLREKQVFISHHCAGSQGVLPQTASATPPTPPTSRLETCARLCEENHGRLLAVDHHCLTALSSLRHLGNYTGYRTEDPAPIVQQMLLSTTLLYI